VAYFGAEILLQDKTIDRKALGAIVFSDRKALNTLNSIIHPAIKQYVLENIKLHSNVFIEGALIHQMGLLDTCKAIIVIDTAEEELMKHIHPDKVNILNYQLSGEEYKQLGTKIIYNNYTKEVIEHFCNLVQTL
jgi:dephospho-CoA kinase